MTTRTRASVRVRPADVLAGWWAVDLYDGAGRWAATAGPYRERAAAKQKADAIRREIRCPRRQSSWQQRRADKE
jgi:hypothetical protein